MIIRNFIIGQNYKTEMTKVVFLDPIFSDLLKFQQVDVDSNKEAFLKQCNAAAKSRLI